MSFFERYEECCRSKGIAPISQEAADLLGVTKGAISHMAKDKTTPKGDTVRRAAIAFGVSADYLLEIDDKTILFNEHTSSPQELRLIGYYRMLGTKSREMINSMAEKLNEVEGEQHERN